MWMDVISLAVSASFIAFLLRPTPSRLRLLVELPPADDPPGWLGSEVADLGRWVSNVFSKGGSIALAAIAGALFAEARQADDIFQGAHFLLVIAVLIVSVVVLGWAIRFAMRLRRLARSNPTVGLPDLSVAESVFLAGFAAAGLCVPLIGWVASLG